MDKSKTIDEPEEEHVEKHADGELAEEPVIETESNPEEEILIPETTPFAKTHLSM